MSTHSIDPPAQSPDRCAHRLKVLADQNRLRVMRTLTQGPLCVGDLMEALQLEQSLLSHHLKVLRDAELVEASRIGKRMSYRISSQAQSDLDQQSIDLGCCKLSF